MLSVKVFISTKFSESSINFAHGVEVSVVGFLSKRKLLDRSNSLTLQCVHLADRLMALADFAQCFVCLSEERLVLNCRLG